MEEVRHGGVYLSNDHSFDSRMGAPYLMRSLAEEEQSPRALSSLVPCKEDHSLDLYSR